MWSTNLPGVHTRMSMQLQLPQELKTKQNHCDEQQKISHAF